MHRITVYERPILIELYELSFLFFSLTRRNLMFSKFLAVKNHFLLIVNII